MYNKEILIKPNLALGYQYFVDYEHPLATGNSGRVLLHRHLYSLHVGYWVGSNDIIHHRDGNKLNNALSNLELMTRSEHSIEHTKNVRLKDKLCPVCRNRYRPHRDRQIYCSKVCYTESAKDTTITKDLLEAEMPFHTWKSLGILFGYSDVGIKKKAVSLGCNLLLKGSKRK